MRDQKANGILTMQFMKKLMTSPKQKSLSVLIKEADEVFSKYIRKRDTKDGFIYCFICGKPVRPVDAHCMHFIDRDHMPTATMK
jgi:hypothetical protein